MRGRGSACQSTSPTEIRIGRNGFSGHRDPQAGRDSAYLFVGGAPAGAESAWIPLAITNVSTSAPCPGSTGPGITLTVSATASIGGAAAGMPVRIYEIMQLRLYQSDGKSWLGMRSVSS